MLKRNVINLPRKYDTGYLYQTVVNRIVFLFSKQKQTSLDKYHPRFCQGTQRHWLIMSLVHCLYCMYSENYYTFEKGYASLLKQLKKEQLTNLYWFIQSITSIELL